MKSSLTRQILEHLAEGSEIAIGSFFPRKYSYARFSRDLFGVDRRRCTHRFPQSREIISSTLTRLQRKGVVARTGSKKKAVWKLTPRGKKRCEGAIDFLGDLPAEDGKIRIVSYDIPEKERRNRDWLRVQLKAVGFKQLQKSVWVGKRPLPKEMVNYLRIKNLSSRVHIISVDSFGTLHGF